MKIRNLIFILPFILFACKHNIDPSKQQFYCKINGKEFIPGVDKSPIGGVGSNTLKIDLDKQNGWFSISSWNSPEYISLIIKLQPNEVLGTGEYLLSNDLTGSKGYYTYNSFLPVTEYQISTIGKIVITKVEGTTLWGTFEFKAKNTKNSDEFIISEGQINNLRY